MVLLCVRRNSLRGVARCLSMSTRITIPFIILKVRGEISLRNVYGHARVVKIILIWVHWILCAKERYLCVNNILRVGLLLSVEALRVVMRE